jgi:hypothetical protein
MMMEARRFLLRELPTVEVSSLPVIRYETRKPARVKRATKNSEGWTFLFSPDDEVANRLCNGGNHFNPN